MPASIQAGHGDPSSTPGDVGAAISATAPPTIGGEFGADEEWRSKTEGCDERQVMKYLMLLVMNACLNKS